MPCLKLSIFKVFFCDPSYGYPLPAYQATIISTKLIPHTCPALWTCVVLMWLYCRPQISKPRLWITPGPLPVFFFFFPQKKRCWNRATSTCLRTRWLFHAVAVAAVEIVWPTKPRFFIIWLLTEKKICQPSCTLFESFVSGPFLPFNVRKGFKVTLLKIFQ